MEVFTVEIPYKAKNSTFHLYAFGDFHEGTIHCAENHLKKKIQNIKDDKYAKVIGMGDYAEFITPSDPRWSSGNISEWVYKKKDGRVDWDDIGYAQEQRVVELLTPIKSKIVGLLYGNHEISIHKHSHQNVHQHICDALGVKNLGYSCFLHLRFERENSAERHLIKGCFTHGSSGAITEGAKLMALMRWMKQNEADIYGYAHVHDYIQKSFTRLGTGDKRIVNKVSVGATTGAWFRTYTQGTESSYGEIKTYPPNELCCAVFTINPNTGFLDVGRSL